MHLYWWVSWPLNDFKSQGPGSLPHVTYPSFQAPKPLWLPMEVAEQGVQAA